MGELKDEWDRLMNNARAMPIEELKALAENQLNTIKMNRDAQKLAALMEDQGYTDEMEFVENECLGSVVPGICMNPGCDCTYDYEPDQDRGWCENCDSQTVKSGAILAGII